MSETTNNTICPHCDMGLVDVGAYQAHAPHLVKCQYCRGDWRNYLVKPAPRPSSWPSEEELRKLYQQPMADNPIPTFMDEYLVSQFGKLSEAESEAYSKMLNCKFTNPDKEKAAREYNQLMDLTLTYRREDVLSIDCPNCNGMWVVVYPDSECQVCQGDKSVRVVVIRPPQP